MNKLKQREAMKKLALTNVGIKATARIIDHTFSGDSFLIGVHLHNAIEREVLAISTTPVKFFRSDRPVVDKRRQRRFTRGHKSYIIGKAETVNITSSGVSVGYRIEEPVK